MGLNTFLRGFNSAGMRINGGALVTEGGRGRIDGIEISCSSADQNTFLQLLLVMIKASKNVIINRVQFSSSKRAACYFRWGLYSAFFFFTAMISAHNHN